MDELTHLTEYFRELNSALQGNAEAWDRVRVRVGDKSNLRHEFQWVMDELDRLHKEINECES